MQYIFRRYNIIYLHFVLRIEENEDDVESFDATDSEDNFSENEKELLNKVRNKRVEYSDSEDEVLGVGGDEDSDSDQSDIALSDVEGQDEDDDLPNEKAWGKDRRKYYSTDYVDQDYGGFQGKDAQLAEFEEEEARNLQKQLAQQLDDDDFNLEIFAKVNIFNLLFLHLFLTNTLYRKQKLLIQKTTKKLLKQM